MARCLVCLVSDQTIPNIIVAAHFKLEYLLLISTPGMEKKDKSKAILDALCLHGLDYSSRHHIIEVLEDSIVDFQEKVADWMRETDQEWEFVVNLTGGTKLMSIAAHDFFTDFGSEMVYVPIPKNEFLTPFPKRRPKNPTLLNDRLSVVEYFAAYGFKVINQSKLDGYQEQANARKDLTEFIFAHYQDIRPLLVWFRDQLHSVKAAKLKKGYDLKGKFISACKYQKEMLERLGYQWEEYEISKKVFEPEWDYLRGGWLEEHLFLSVRNAVPQGASADVRLNVRCEDPSKLQNEFDVVFSYENTLFLIECKSLGAAEGNEQHIGGTISDFLYKLGALRRNFGLTPRAFLATTSEDVLDNTGNLKPNLVERGRQFLTEILPLLKNMDVTAYFKEKIFHKN